MATHDNVDAAQEQRAARHASGGTPVTLNGIAYLGFSIPAAARNAVAYPNVLVAHIGSAMTGATWSGAPTAAPNGVAYPDVLVAHVGSGMTDATHSVVYLGFDMAGATGVGLLHAVLSGVGFPDVLVANLHSGVSPVTWNRVPLSAPDGDLLAAHVASYFSSATQIGVAYHDMLMTHLGSGLFPARVRNNGLYPDDVPEGAPGASFQHLHPVHEAAAAAEPLGGYSYYGVALPRVAQVVAHEILDRVVTRAFTERVRHGLPALGLAIASVAVTGLTAGVPNPAMGLGLFATLVGGLALVTTIGVLRA